MISIKHNIIIGDDFKITPNLEKYMDIGVGILDGLPWAYLSNDEFEIDKRLTLSLTLCNTNKSYHIYYDSIYHLTGEVKLTKSEKITEILLNDPIGEYDQFIK